MYSVVKHLICIMKKEPKKKTEEDYRDKIQDPIYQKLRKKKNIKSLTIVKK